MPTNNPARDLTAKRRRILRFAITQIINNRDRFPNPDNIMFNIVMMSDATLRTQIDNHETELRLLWQQQLADLNSSALTQQAAIDELDAP
jgi:hypothetical protein